MTEKIGLYRAGRRWKAPPGQDQADSGLSLAVHPTDRERRVGPPTPVNDILRGLRSVALFIRIDAEGM